MSYTLIASNTREARKPHCCIWCNETINRGELYINKRGSCDGNFQNDHYHPECELASIRFFTEYKEDYFDPGEFGRGSMAPKGEPIA